MLYLTESNGAIIFYSTKMRREKYVLVELIQLSAETLEDSGEQLIQKNLFAIIRKMKIQGLCSRIHYKKYVG